MMREIGRVLFMQIQRSSLKAGQRPFAYYDPAPLLVVDRLLLEPSGARAMHDGQELIDVHNAQHPDSRNRGENGLSFGFAGHYEAMRERFGPHLTDGIAGENILIDTPGVLTMADLGAAIVFRGDDGREVRLVELEHAPPCVEFSQFAALSDGPMRPEQTRATLQFLGDGMRGFYARLQGESAELRAGDRVFVES